jgi:hypothetical protein
MKLLSTYGAQDDTESICISGVNCMFKTSPHNKIQAEDTKGGFFLKEIPPGESFSIELYVQTGQHKPENTVVNWICNATKTRGALFFNPVDNVFSGEIDGKFIRESLSLTPQVLDTEGRIVTSGLKATLWLEGRQSFFPMASIEEKQPFAHAFVHLDVDITSGKRTIFSKDTVQAVYNRNSYFCDRDSGSPYDGPAKYFSLYEVWRQLIEVVLNSEDVDGFYFDTDSEETTVVAAVSRVLYEIFPKRSYAEIKKLRTDDYPLFCRYLQSYFFERCLQ